MRRSRMMFKENKLYHNKEDTEYSVVQDEIYPKMYRVKFSDGSVSDMANYTRTRYKLKGYLSNEINCGLEAPEELRGAFK